MIIQITRICQLTNNNKNGTNGNLKKPIKKQNEKDFESILKKAIDNINQF